MLFCHFTAGVLMRILFSAAILLFILNSSSYPQSYKVDIGSSERFGDFYSPVKTLELRKPAPGTYLQNSFYIKSKDNISTFEIEKFVKLYLINSGYIDLRLLKSENHSQNISEKLT